MLSAGRETSGIQHVSSETNMRARVECVDLVALGDFHTAAPSNLNHSLTIR